MSATTCHSAAKNGRGIFTSGIRFFLVIIGPDSREAPVAAPSQPTNFGWVSALCLTVAMALALVVAGHGAGRRSEDVAAALLFWSGVALLVIPTSIRISWPSIAREERLLVLFLLSGGLFFYKSVYSPTGFSDHDEFLHWVAADDLMTSGRLFLSNPLLPIGPDYPALEIIASAIVHLTGLPLFAASSLLLVILRGAFVGALFLLYEKMTGAARLSAMACLVYMGCSTFVQFDAMFSYESLGIVFCAIAFAVEAASKDLADWSRLNSAGLVVLLLAGLAATHHLSAAYAAFYFVAVAVLEVLRRGASRRDFGIAIALAIFAVGAPLLWMKANGSPLIGYLGPAVETGLKSVLRKFTGLQTIGQWTQSVGAPSQSLGPRSITALAVLLLALGLTSGFFRSLAMAAPADARAGWGSIRNLLNRRWSDSRALLFSLVALAFPISIAFRLTAAGWEIGNRMGSFVFLAVGLVVSVSIRHFWEGQAPHAWRHAALGIALAAIVLGGVTASSLNPIRGHYRAGADSESIESMAVQTALWTKEWLGPGNRFAADRVNRLLLAGYGRQDVRVDIVDGFTTSRVYEPEILSPDDLHVLARSNLEFLLVDMRLSASPPVLGFYFEPWEPHRGIPLSSRALLKFDQISGAVRIYDNGWLRIYDIRGLHGRS